MMWIIIMLNAPITIEMNSENTEITYLTTFYMEII